MLPYHQESFGYRALCRKCEESIAVGGAVVRWGKIGGCIGDRHTIKQTKGRTAMYGRRLLPSAAISTTKEAGHGGLQGWW